MKILIINTTFNKGGAARIAQEIFEFLNKQTNNEAYFAHGRGLKIKDNKLFKFGFILEVYLHVFLVRFLGIEGFGTYFSTRRLINFIKKEKFDLIQFHNLHGYYLNFFTLVKSLKSQNIPVIWRLPDEWPITSFLAYSADCYHCKPGEGKYVNPYAYPKTFNKLFLKYMLKKKQSSFESLKDLTIVSPSHWFAEKVKKSYLGHFDINVIHNGVNTNLFKPADNKKKLRKKYNLLLNKKIVLFSAINFKEKRKGIDYVIELAKKFEKDILFLGVGSGKLPKINNIYNFGYVSDKKTMAELYSLSDIYIFPSLAETFGIVAIEAMACGLPVVAFKIGPMKEIITEKEGILIETGNSEKLAEAVNLILKNEEKRKKMSLCARERVVNNFSLGKMLKEYENIYHNTLFQ